MKGMKASLVWATLTMGLHAQVVRSYDCPTVPGELRTFTLTAPTKVSLTLPSVSLCTLTLEESDGTSKPVARSYDGSGWERSGGIFAAQLQEWTCRSGSCTATLPGHVGVYTLRAYAVTSLSEKAKVARFLESASFGATPTQLSAMSSNSFGQYVAKQMQTPPTWHRELWRRRTNARWTFDHFEFAAHLDPCAEKSTWRRHVFSAKDREQRVKIEMVKGLWQVSVVYAGANNKSVIRSQIKTLRFVNPKDVLIGSTTLYAFCSDEEEFHRGVYRIRYNKGCRQLRTEDLMIDFPSSFPSTLSKLNGDLPALSNGAVWQTISTKHPEYMMKTIVNLCSSLPALTYPPTFPVTPVFAKTQDGFWLMHDPRVNIRTNSLTQPIVDGGQFSLKAKRTTYCSNAPRTFLNEATCTMSTKHTCRPGSTNANAAAKGLMVCGSPGEVSNDISLGDSWMDVASVKSSQADDFGLEEDSTGPEVLSRQKGYVWSEVALKSSDQLRQRIAFALLHIYSLPKRMIKTEEYSTEMFLNFYDVFVRHAFGNYRDILREMAYNPLMAESLTYRDSKSLLGNWIRQDGLIIFPDENFSRELMQLFTIGLVELNMDGTEALGPDNQTVSTYDSDDIMSFARAWTGFKGNVARANIEDADKANRIDPMTIDAADRDRFPKSDLDGGYIGDFYPLCTDLPARAFLHVGAKYRLLGSSRLPELVVHNWQPTSATKQLQLPSNSALYTKLCRTQGGTCSFPNVVVLDGNLACTGSECKVDTVHVVQVGTVYYEYIRRPCVELPFFTNGTKVAYRTNETDNMCVNPRLPVASEACCDQSRNAIPSCEYGGERMTLASAERRCTSMKRNLCEYRKVAENATCPQDKHRWTSAKCSIQVKVRPDGQIAVVHFDNAPESVEAATQNFFVAYWEGKAFPTSGATGNSCGGGFCKQDIDGNCICKTEVTDTPVFTSPPSDASAILQRLRIGHAGPDVYSPALTVSGDTNGYRYFPSQSCCGIDTVFEVKDRNGQTKYLRNINSTVKVVGTTFKFRNPPHFNSLLESEYSIADAQHETEAVLDHLFYHKNTPPFLAYRFIQRFGISNPSPRYILAVATAFATGSYSGNGVTMGSGKYGDMAAMIAAVLLDREARSTTLDHDPAHGSLREPILKVMSFLRGTAFNSTVPFVELDLMNEKIGQMAYEQASVFSFFRPEYTPVELVKLGMVAPEAEVMSSGKIIGLLNGIISMVKYGLVNCNDGFGAFGECTVTNSSGVITYQPSSLVNFNAVVQELGDALTGGRLSTKKALDIASAMSSPTVSSDPQKALQLGLQLIATSPEFHSTSRVNPQVAPKRTAAASPINENTAAPYKAVIHLALVGGCDSFNVLVPQPSCTALHKQYKNMRGRIAQLNTLPLSGSNGGSKSCKNFAVHNYLPFLQKMYNEKDLAFLANVGVLTVPCGKTDCEKKTLTDLFSHNSMQDEVNRLDPNKKSVGTASMGRMVDVLQANGYRTSRTTVDSSPSSLGCRTSLPPPIVTLDQTGVRPFNEKPSAPNMTEVVKKLNGESGEQCGLYGDIWSTLLRQSLNQTDGLHKVLNGKTLNTFPDEGLGQRFKLTAQLIAAAINGTRPVNRDFFFLPFDGFDTHSDVTIKLEENFEELNSTLFLFVDELKQLGVWDQVVIVQTSDFGRTLTENSNAGTDHGWGGHYWMAGGSVKGGRIVGEYPDNLEVGSDLSWERGRYIPTTPWDSVFNSVAEWTGVRDEQLSTVLPNRAKFPSVLKRTDLFV